VIEGSEELNTLQLKHYLAVKLPDYMIPAYFVPLDRIPLKPSGKVDLESLAAHGTTLKTGVAYVPPETDMEKNIGRIWEELLAVDHMGLDDNFFDLGGNSLRIIRLGNKLKETFGKSIPVMKLFEYPTIRSLAEYLELGDSKAQQEFADYEKDMSQVIASTRKSRTKRADKRKQFEGEVDNG
ncbi:MAG: hypothetical protein GY940_20060, partial [bacterium]|nr:hypothetical protein [bacterium]